MKKFNVTAKTLNMGKGEQIRTEIIEAENQYFAMDVFNRTYMTIEIISVDEVKSFTNEERFKAWGYKNISKVYEEENSDTLVLYYDAVHRGKDMEIKVTYYEDGFDIHERILGLEDWILVVQENEVN